MPSFLACSRTGTGDTNSARRESAGAESERRNLGDCGRGAVFSEQQSGNCHTAVREGLLSAGRAPSAVASRAAHGTTRRVKR